MINLRNRIVDSFSVEKILDLASASCNRNVIPGDSAGVRGNIHFRSTAMVSRGLESSSFARITDQCVRITRACTAEVEGTKEYKAAPNARECAMFRDYIVDGCGRLEIA